MHIAPFNNRNQAIIGVDDPLVPLVYFNIINLTRGESFTSHVPGYETCVVPATGTVDVTIGTETYPAIGQRRANVWDAEPEGVYIPTGLPAQITCGSDTAEIFVAGARFDTVLTPFAIRHQHPPVTRRPRKAKRRPVPFRRRIGRRTHHLQPWPQAGIKHRPHSRHRHRMGLAHIPAAHDADPDGTHDPASESILQPIAKRVTS